MQYDYQSPWFTEALKTEDKIIINQLKSEEIADICIVGGGYTGLWTAINIKEKNPTTNIILIEKDLCGSGASGRNGGCMIPLSSKFPAMKKIVGGVLSGGGIASLVTGAIGIGATGYDIYKLLFSDELDEIVNEIE